MRPKVKFLTDELIKKIINEAIEILCKLGVEINNQNKRLQELSARAVFPSEYDDIQDNIVGIISELEEEIDTST